MINILLMSLIVFSRLGGALVMFAILGSMLTLEEFGLFSSAYSLAKILSTLVDYGFGQSLLRDIGSGSKPAETYVQEGLRVKLLFSVLTIIALPLIAHQIGFSTHGAFLAAFLMLATILGSFAEFHGAAIRALGFYRQESAIQGLTTTLLLVALYIGGAMGATVHQLATILLVSNALHLILVTRVLDKVLPGTRAQLIRPPARRELLRGAPYAADQGVGNVLVNIDVLVVAYFLGPAVAGVYQAGQKLVQGLTVGPMVLSNVYLPKLSRAAVSDTLAFRVIALRVTTAIVALGVMGCLLLNSIPASFFSWALNGKFESLTSMLPAFASLVLARHVAATFGLMLTSLGKQQVRFVANLLTLCFVLSVAPFAMHYGGVLGMVYTQVAAASLLCATYLVAVLMHPVTQKRLDLI